MKRPGAPSILIVSLTVAVPARRRTWQQAQALAARGWRVTVIGPRPKGGAVEARDITVLGFPHPFEGSGRLGLFVESLVAAVLVAALLVRAVLTRRIDVVQVVNPPDWPLLLVLPLRLFGIRLVYDLADDAPSLYRGKFGHRGLVWSALRLLARLAMREADLVVTSNEVYRRLARRFGHKADGSVLAIRSYLAAPRPQVPRVPSAPLQIGYFGVLGQQDGVDLLLEAVALLRDRGLGRFRVDIVGDGPARRSLEDLCRQRDLRAVVGFSGFLQGTALRAAIGRFDVAVIPDRPTCYTHRISMNKVFVYAAHGIATVSTRLRETERLLGDAAGYAETATPAGLAMALQHMLHEPTRLRHADRIRLRARSRFEWADEAERYVTAVERLRVVPTPALHSALAPERHASLTSRA